MAALDNIASELLKAANVADLNFKKTRDQAERDKAVRLRRIVENLKALSAGGLTPNLDEVLTEGNTSTNTLDVGGITTDYVQLDTAATPTLAVGMTRWNASLGVPETRLGGGNVTGQWFLEGFIVGVNKTGATLNESEFRAVRIRSVAEGGAQGQRLAVVLAQADSDANSATTIGIVTETVPNNQQGLFTTTGDVNEINTTGAMSWGGSETWVDGDILYLSPDHAGYLTKVKPIAPKHMIVVGWVVYAHAVHGKIFVKVDNGYELDELHNVRITSVANNDLLQYDSTLQVWKNVSASVAVPTPTLAQVTTAGNTTTNAITVGGLVAIGSTNTAGIVNITNNFSGTYPNAVNVLFPNISSSSVQAAGLFIGKSLSVYNGWGVNYTHSADGSTSNRGSIAFYGTDNIINWFANGNVTINSTTNAGYKLDVNGTARVQGNLTLGNNTDVNILFGSSYTLGISGGKININNNTSVASNFSVGTTSLSSTARFVVGGSVNLAGSLGRAMAVDSTIVANANDAILVGLDINPTFTNGAFTGVQNYSLRALGSLGSDGTNVYSGYVARIQNTKDYDTTNGVLLLVNQNGGAGGHFIKAVNAQAGQVRFLVDGNGSLTSIGNGTFTGDVRATKIRWNTDGDGWIGDGGLDGTFVVNTNNTERYRVTPNGNLLLNTTTDAGYKLDVNGSVKIESSTLMKGGLSLNYTTPQFTVINAGSGNKAWSWIMSGNDLQIREDGIGFPMVFKPAGNIITNQNGGNFLIGTTTDAGYKLDVNGNTRTTGSLNVGSSYGTFLAGASTDWAYTIAGGESAVIAAANIQGSTRTIYGVTIPAQSANLVLGTSYGYDWGMSFNIISTGKLGIKVNKSTDAALIFANGNWAIGTTTDAGYKLDVNGTARIQGAVTATANGHRFGNLEVLTSGNAGGTGQGIVVTGVDTTFQFNGSGSPADMFQFRNWAGITTVTSINNVDRSIIRVYGGFQSGNLNGLSGNALSLTPTYNFTGTSTNTVRGIYYNPTLTSLTGVTHRGAEIASGDFIWGNGYSQYNTSAVEGFVQFQSSGSSTKIWIRPSNNQAGFTNNYWGYLENSGYTTTLKSGNYHDLSLSGESIRFKNNNLNEVARFAVNTGNLLIGTTTDAGYKLDVNGTGRFSSTLTIATTASGASPSNSILISTSESGNGGRISWGDSNTSILRFSNSLYFREYTGNFVFESTSSSTILFAVRPSNTTVSSGKFITNGSVTASSALAQGVFFNNTLVAAANNDVLVGLDINPTFTLGGFSGTQRYGLRVQNSPILINGTYNSLGSEGINPDSLININATIVGRGGSRAIAMRLAPTINANSVGSQTFAALEINPTYQNVGAGSNAYSLNSIGTNYVGPINVFGWNTIWQQQGGTSTYHIVGAPNGQGFRVQVNSNIAGYSFEFNGSGIPTYTLRNNNIDAVKVYSTGNVGVATTTDAGYKLDVNGTGRFSGQVKFDNSNIIATGITSQVANFQIARANTNTSVEIIGGATSVKFDATSASASTQFAGKVAIGSAYFTPTEMLHVDGSIKSSALTLNGPVLATGGVLSSIAGYTGLFTVPTNPPGQQTLDIQNGIIVNVL